MGDVRGVVDVSAGHEHVGDTLVSGIASSAADVLGMSVEGGVRGICAVCEMYMYLARGAVGGEW